MAGTPVGGGMVGDPYCLKPDGSKYTFNGVAGNTYNYASDNTIKVMFRLAAVVGTTSGATYIDQVTIQYTPLIGSTSNVVVGLNSVTVGGATLAKGSAPVAFANSGSARYWVGSAGEDRIDVAYGQWKVAVIQDPGTNTGIHPTTSPLYKVKHLGLFVDAIPSGMNLLNCIYLAGGPNVAVSLFQVSL